MFDTMIEINRNIKNDHFILGCSIQFFHSKPISSSMVINAKTAKTIDITFN
jgi:hypothetical protein